MLGLNLLLGLLEVKFHVILVIIDRLRDETIAFGLFNYGYWLI
jgi:hypothetical protein